MSPLLRLGSICSLVALKQYSPRISTKSHNRSFFTCITLLHWKKRHFVAPRKLQHQNVSESISFSVIVIQARTSTNLLEFNKGTVALYSPRGALEWGLLGEPSVKCTEKLT